MQLYLFSTARSIQENLGKSEGFLPKSMTLGEFFSQVLFVKNLTKLSPFIRKIILAKVLKNFDFTAQEKQYLFFEYNFVGFLETSPFLLDLFAELFASQVELDWISQKDIYGEYEDHLRVLNQIYVAYKRELQENGFYDYPREYEIFWSFLDKFKKIEIFLDGFLSPFELKVLREIAEKIPIVLHLSLDIFNLSHFAFLNQELKADYVYTIAFPSGEILEYKENKLQSVIELQSCDLKISECAFAIQKINDWINQGISPQEIVLVVSNESFLSFLKVCDEKKNFNFAMGIESSALCVLEQKLQECFYEGKDKLKYLSLEVEKYSKNLPLALRFKIDEILLAYQKNQAFLEEFSFEQIVSFFLQEIQALQDDDLYGGQIKVMGMLETRGMKFKKVILVDFDEDNIPKVSQNDMFLNSPIRHALGMPTLKDKQDLQKHYYLELLKNAQEVQILFLENKLSSFVKEIGLEEVIHKSPYVLFEEKNQDFIYQEEEIEEKLPYDFKFSFSAINVFQTCKRSFYFTYLQKLQEKHSKREVEIGQGIHSVLFETYSKLKDFSRLKDEFFALISQKQQESDDVFLQFEYELAKRTMKEFLEKETQTPPDEILYLEKAFCFEWRGFVLGGIIDRVDCLGGVVRIIDYKYTDKMRFSKIQGILYYLYIASQFENKEIEVYFYALKNAKIEKLEITQEDILEFENLLIEMRNETKFEMTDKTSHCRECAYRILCNR